MYHNFVSGHHDFLQTEPKRSQPNPPGETKNGNKRTRGESRGFNNVDITNVLDLVEAIHSRRQLWSTKGHSAKTYVVSNQDPIKMHINMYLAHMACFFFDGKLDQINALVLDASDMGTSLAFDIFGIHNIVVPNYNKSSTDFEIMRQRMPSCMSLPVSVEDYITIWANSDQNNYASKITEQAGKYKYEGNAKQKHLKNLTKFGVGARPPQFDIVYLDWCGAFSPKSRKTIKTLLSNTDPTQRPKMLAVTGSAMGHWIKKGGSLTKALDNIITFMKRRSYQMDQVFIYHRHVSHSRVAPGVEIQRTILEVDDRVKASPEGYSSKHEGTIVRLYKHSQFHYRIKFDDSDFGTQKVHRSKITNKGGAVMFFISFICASPILIDQWNIRFQQCGSKACKLFMKNRFCLYHDTDNTTLRFCNRLLGKFYIYSTQEMESDDNFQTMLGGDVPLLNFDGLLSQNNKQKAIPSIFALQNKEWQMCDAKGLQDYIKQTRNITYQGRREFNIRNIIVRVEAVFEKSLAFSISSTGNQSYLSLKNKNISDIFRRVECLFGKGNTDSTDALIFITKMAFEQITDSSEDSEEEESEEESEEEPEEESEEMEEPEEESEEESEEEMKPFRDIKLHDRVTYLWNPPDETYDATVVKLTISARVVTLKFDDGEKKTFQGGWFNDENYGKQWWYTQRL